MQPASPLLLPLGNSTFDVLRSDNQIYVDKTDLIYDICAGRSKIFLSRPRRFGKSLLVSSFESLFKDGLKFFKGLKIEKLWNDAIYNVVHLDFSLIKDFSSSEDFTDKFESRIGRQFQEAGLEGPFTLDKLDAWLQHLPRKSLVLLIDEYDAPLTSCLDQADLFTEVQRYLSEFYSILKAREGCFRFFFMTGITKLANTGIFSGFNNLEDISLEHHYAALLGYTEDELQAYFAPYLSQASEILGLSLSETLNQMRLHYDGFCFDETAERRVYCPWSILNFLKKPSREFQHYWYESGGRPTVLMKYLSKHALTDPRTFAQEIEISLSDLNVSKASADMQLEALLFQAGYLTIHSKATRSTVKLGYPNLEVSESLAKLYCAELLNNKPSSKSTAQKQLAESLSRNNLDEIVAQFNSIYNSIDCQRHPVRDEASCRAILQVLLIGADMLPTVELHAALGRSGMQVDVGGRRWIFEFKYAQKDAEAQKLLEDAAAQLRALRYGETFGAAAPNNLMRAAIVFSGESRRFVRWALA